MKEMSHDISTFTKQFKIPIKPDQTFQHHYVCVHEYTLEEIEKIIASGSIEEQQKLSRYFYDRDGFYKRIILYYATLLKYSGLLVPNPSFGNQLSKLPLKKLYFKAMRYIEHLNLPEILTRMSIKALIDGCYYGVIKNLDKEQFTIIDLPSGFCRSRYKDGFGNDLIEFDVRYFYSIIDMQKRVETLKSYPKVISSWFKRFDSGKTTESWVLIPGEIGICFPFFDDGRPLFLSVIPATIQYDEAVENERERELEDIRKIIVQKVPHLTDGQLLFEPDEALEMHAGTVGMLRGNKNLSVLTTYADVDAVVSKTSNEGAANALEKMVQNSYSQAGASINLFSPTGTQALATSINNDMALMMILGNKYSRFITFIINQLFANQNLSFSYVILPINYYNQKEYIDETLKLAQSGYSFLLPSIASGVSQYSLMNVKELENDVLKLHDMLIPLTSSYTQSGTGNPVGAPKKPDEEKAVKTIQNENAIDNQ